MGAGSGLNQSSEGGYKKYIAILNQSGTSAPVATVLENSLGGALVWSYSGVGVYIATLAGAFPTELKIIILITNSVFDTQTALYWTSANTLELDTSTLAGVATNNHLTNVSVEIRVYP